MNAQIITKVKVVVTVKEPGTPCWPCINFDYEKETARILKIMKAVEPFIKFDVFYYKSSEEAAAVYEQDQQVYDGILVLMMANWQDIELFYARKAKEGGLPAVLADVPYCGSGSMLNRVSFAVRSEELPVPMIASMDYEDIAKGVKLFEVIKKMQNTKILVIADKIKEAEQSAASEVWGCQFVNRTAEDLNQFFETVDAAEATDIVQKWKTEAADVLEPSDADILESAKLYLALRQMRDELNADALTVDCLTLSYGDKYTNNTHMYPCLSHAEMSRRGEVAVCEADINATLASLVTLYLTGRPGYVSDPVIDTSSDQIIYAHCVACTKICGKDDPRTCKYYIRSHAEDQRGASVQVIFPANEKLTTTMFHFPEREVCIHSSTSVGNVGGDEGCRSKLAATTKAENLLYNWMPLWHRVTVFGEYRKQFMNLFKMKQIHVIEEDKELMG